MASVQFASAGTDLAGCGAAFARSGVAAAALRFFAFDGAAALAFLAATFRGGAAFFALFTVVLLVFVLLFAFALVDFALAIVASNPIVDCGS